MVWLIVLTALSVMGALIGRILARTELPPSAQSLTITGVACVASLSFTVWLPPMLRDAIFPPAYSGGIGAASSGCAEVLAETLIAALPVIVFWLARRVMRPLIGPPMRPFPFRAVISGVLGALIGALSLLVVGAAG
jgi:hypothetical protein